MLLEPKLFIQAMVFLSENAHFAEIVTKHGIKFIGPSADLHKKNGRQNRSQKNSKRKWVACN